MPHTQHPPKRYYTYLMNLYRRQPLAIPFFNHFIRFYLKITFLISRRKINRYCQGRQKLINYWYADKKIFFGLSLNRSGSGFLANLLNAEIADAVVCHEVNIFDYLNYPQAFQALPSASAYIEGYRRQEIYYRLKDKQLKIYGELNPFLCRHAPVLKKVFPRAKFFHLIRDGRDFVRANMTKARFDKKDPWRKYIQPGPGDPYCKYWPTMNRFEKLCWQWQSDNRYLREHIGHTLRFEKLLSDYGYFKSQLLDYLGLTLPVSSWRLYVNKKINPTPVHKFPAWPYWTAAQKKSFLTICGEEMKQSGYRL